MHPQLRCQTSNNTPFKQSPQPLVFCRTKEVMYRQMTTSHYGQRFYAVLLILDPLLLPCSPRIYLVNVTSQELGQSQACEWTDGVKIKKD